MSTNDLRKYTLENGAPHAPENPPPAGEAPAAPGAGLGMSLSEVRETYVGRGYHRFEKAFDKCDAAGKPVNTVSIAPFFFSFFWFFYRKMYREGLVILAISVAVSWLAETFLKSSEGAVMTGVGAAVAMNAKSLYWRAVDRQIARAMSLFPDSPPRAIAWLQAKGGVNIWAAAIGVLFFALALFAAYQSVWGDGNL